MSKLLARLAVLVFALSACDTTNPEDCKVTCATDTDCPSGQTCGDLGRCSSGVACPCTSDEFLACLDSSNGRYCSSDGTGTETRACDFGCNSDAKRCNECEPSAASCASNGMTIQRCGADGTPLPDETCSLACNGKDHCPYISPKWAPDVCDQVAMAASLDVQADMTLDTSIDGNCTGGIIAQSNGPEICVARYGTITIGAKLAVTGSRAIAFVSDGALQITGTLDVSANGSTNGPGGGTLVAGSDAQEGIGGGGAGFRNAGAAGGDNTGGQGGGGAGGAIVDPLTRTALLGGTRSGTSVATGGGGGAAMLISCRGGVTVAASGVIDAGGGGGGGGRDVLQGFVTRFYGGWGGGSGGYVVLQGTQVSILGSLYANGGGGGGGCDTDDCIGIRGEDGLPTLASGSGGGTATGAGGAGGKGGVNILVPTYGSDSTISPGGGGASLGRFQVYAPSGITPMLAPVVSSPPMEPALTITTR